MKLKLLALCLTIGLFAFGTGSRAAEPTTSTANKEQAAVKAKGPADALLSLICNAVLAGKHPQACTDGCANLLNPSWNDLTCCVASAKSFGKIDKGLESKISLAAYPICTSLSCGPSQAGTFIGNLCGSVCCNTGYDKVDNCLSQVPVPPATKIPPGKGKTCADFPLKSCVLCTGDCCPDVDGKYCIASACKKNKAGKPQCPAASTLKEEHTGGW